MVQLVRWRLCEALGPVLADGFLTQKSLWGGRQHPWHFIDAFLERTSFRRITALALLKAIREIDVSHKSMHEQLDSHFRSFICVCLNQRMLHEWCLSPLCRRAMIAAVCLQL